MTTAPPKASALPEKSESADRTVAGLVQKIGGGPRIYKLHPRRMYQPRKADLPQWLKDKRNSCPEAGTGIHAFVFSLARQLHAHMSPAEVENELICATANCGRPVPLREIKDAVRNSQAVAWQPREATVRRPVARHGEQEQSEDGEAEEIRRTSRFPKLDLNARRCRLADAAVEGVAELYDLWERSPVKPPDGWEADDWLDWLFPVAEWLCLSGDHPSTARTRRREKWYFGPASECSFVVPSPMTGPSGVPLNPSHPKQRSHRCLDNTGPRRWLVVEFDPKRWKDLPPQERAKWPDEQAYDGAMIDEQARLHWHIRGEAGAAGWPPLRLCVHSAGKSLHGWYGPVASEDAAFDLMAYAASMGADPSSWNRAQLMRLPGGVRKVKPVVAELPDGWGQPPETVKQEVYFFDPHSYTT